MMSIVVDDIETTPALTHAMAWYGVGIIRISHEIGETTTQQ